MIILFNPTNSEIELMNQGNEIKIPANAEFMVTEEDAEFVKNTLGFIKAVGAKEDVTIPAIEEVIEDEELSDEEEVIEDESTDEDTEEVIEDEVEEVKETKSSKSKAK